MGKSPHYQGMVVHLRQSAETQWQLAAELDGQIVSYGVFWADRDTAISRAEALAGWFDAEVRIEEKGGRRGTDTH